jgi:hypothetical protein
MADLVTLKGGPLDGRTVKLNAGKLTVPIIRNKTASECYIEQGTYEVQFNPSQAKTIIATFHAG